MENKEKKVFEQADCTVLPVQEDLITFSPGPITGGGSSSPIDPVGGNP